MSRDSSLCRFRSMDEARSRDVKAARIPRGTATLCCFEGAVAEGRTAGAGVTSASAPQSMTGSRASGVILLLGGETIGVGAKSTRISSSSAS